MNIRNMVALASGLALLASSHGFAQVPNLGGASNAQSAARAQAQAQQRVQAQVQQRAAAAAQARIQADAARAAQIAQQAAAMAQRQVEIARRQAVAGANVRVGANVAANNRVRAGGVSARSNANANLGIQAGLIIPRGLTEADVRIYDEIFGRFNPLRPQPPAAPEPSQPEASSPPANPTAQNTNSPQADDPNQPPAQRPAAASLLAARGEVDLTSRLTIAMRQRRAQISELRDHAVETGNAQLLLQADRIEETMNAFVAAQTRAAAEAQAAAGNRPNVARPPLPAGQINGRGQAGVNGNANGGVNPRAANAGAAGNGNAQGASGVR